MRLTPQDIHHKEFKRGMRGYNEAEVDLFLDEVYEEFERIYKDNHELKDEAEKLKDKIERFEKLEKTLNETLISAQQTANDLRDKARLESEAMIQAANDSVQLKLSEAATEAARLEENLGELIETEKTFREELKRFVLGFAKRIDSVSAVVETQSASSLTAPSTDASEADASETDISQPDVVGGIESAPGDETFISDVTSGMIDIDAPEEILGDHKAEPVEIEQPSPGLFNSEVKEHELLMLADHDSEPHTLAVVDERKDDTNLTGLTGRENELDKTQEFDPSSHHFTSDTYKPTGFSALDIEPKDTPLPESNTVTNESEGFTIRSGTASFWGKRSETADDAQKDSSIIAEGTLEAKGGAFVSGHIDNFISGEKVVNKEEDDDQPKDENPSGSLFGYGNKTP